MSEAAGKMSQESGKVEGPAGGAVPRLTVAPGEGRLTGQKKGNRRVLLAGVAIVGLAGTGWFIASRWGLESTDDAQVEGDVVNVSTRIPGKVLRLLVSDDQIVNAGDVLVQLDTDQLTQQLHAAQADRDTAAAALESARAQLSLTERNTAAALTQTGGGLTLAQQHLNQNVAELEQAKANVAAAQTRYGLAKLELNRSRTLVAQHAVPQQELDTRQSAFENAQAELAAANASLAAKTAAIAGARGDIRSASGRVDAARTAPEQIEAARAAVHLSEARLAQAESALELAKLNLSYSEVRAPIRGQVTRRAV